MPPNPRATYNPLYQALAKAAEACTPGTPEHLIVDAFMQGLPEHTPDRVRHELRLFITKLLSHKS